MCFTTFIGFGVPLEINLLDPGYLCMDALHVSCDYSIIYEALSSVFLFDVVFSVGLLRAVAEHPFCNGLNMRTNFHYLKRICSVCLKSLVFSSCVNLTSSSVEIGAL